MSIRTLCSRKPNVGAWRRGSDRRLSPSRDQRGLQLTIQARQAMPPLRQQSAAQTDAATRRTLTRQPVPMHAPTQSVSSSLTARPVLLPRNLIINKQVIARTSGKQLGYVAQLYVDPQRMEVVSLDLRSDWVSLSRSADSSIMLSALRQIGDVVLVHDESAANDSFAMAAGWGAIKLIGMAVETEDGQWLGKVRDFTFSPDDGRISSIKFDRFGLPAISDTLVSVCGLPVWEVLRVETARLLVRSSPQISKETDGLLDRASAALLSLQRDTAAEDHELRLQEWERTYGPAYRAFYGQDKAPLQLPPSKDRQSVKKILTSAYSERNPSPVLRQSSLPTVRRQPRDPRQRRDPEAFLAASPSVTTSAGPAYPRQSRTLASEPLEQPVARSNEGALQGVPLVRREQLPAHQRRDIDGAYGELPTEQFSPRRLAPRPQQPSVNAQALRYEDFLVVSDGSQDPVQAYAKQQDGWGRL